MKTSRTDRPLTLLTGGTGFLGRWLLLELLRRDHEVVALVRRAQDRLGELQTWARLHGVDPAALRTVEYTLDDSLDLRATLGDDFGRVRDVFHLAARFEFGLSFDAARRANVDAPRELLRQVADAPALRRFVHTSGYRTMGRAWAEVDASDDAALRRYAEVHGAYETSKMEAHGVMLHEASRLGVPLTILSPALVIGDSQTGETTQLTGLGTLVQMLVDQRLPVLVSDAHTWLPVVAVDAVAAFAARVPEYEETVGEHYVLMDERTPNLIDLVELMARHLGLRAPHRRLSPRIARALPRAVTGVDSEALSFLSSDRYDNHNSVVQAQRMGVPRPSTESVVRGWLDYLVDTAFLTQPPTGGGFVSVAGGQVFARGNKRAPELVLLHGLLLNERTWEPLEKLIGRRALAVDLPGQGRSGPGTPDRAGWLEALLAAVQSKPVLVGHSLGTGVALDYAHAHPDRVRGLVLISPYFLQARPAMPLRKAWLVRLMLRFMGATRMAAMFPAAARDLMVDPLKWVAYSRVGAQIADEMRRAAAQDNRRDLVAKLRDLAVPVTIIHGAHDRLVHASPSNVRVIEIPETGHFPQLDQVARVAPWVADALAVIPHPG